MRSVDMRCLADLERKALAIVERRAKNGDGQATLELGGDRPVGAILTNHPLVQVCPAISQALGITTFSKAAGTEVNAPLSMTIPAGDLFVTSGENGHRPDEVIEAASLATGITVLLPIRLAVTQTR